MPEDGEAAWLRDRAHPLTTLDPELPRTDLSTLRERLRDAAVVGLGRSTHGAHELTILTHRILRLLVEDLGFRAVAIEEDWGTIARIDEHLRTGEGDPRVLLEDAAPHWRTDEVLEALKWMRSFNELHPADPVRLVGIDISSVDDMGLVELLLAQITIWWHEQTGSKVAYWGGFTHTAVGHARRVSFPPASPVTHRNAGSRLREHFGSRYVSVALTFHHGVVDPGPSPCDVPAPPRGSADAVLGATDLDVYWVDLHGMQPDPVRAWLDSPARLRLIGPRYAPAEDSTNFMSGGSLAEWFDLIVHTRDVTPVSRLEPDGVNVHRTNPDTTSEPTDREHP
jgi:erythromycin esterase